MEKVMPAGVNKLGYKADTSPVLRPLMGKILARAFTVSMAIKASELIRALRRGLDIGSKQER